MRCLAFRVYRVAPRPMLIGNQGSGGLVGGNPDPQSTKYMEAGLSDESTHPPPFHPNPHTRTNALKNEDTTLALLVTSIHQ